MGQHVTIVAQQAMDLYYQDYKPSSAFFTLDDFVSYCGNTAADIFQKDFDLQYAMIRQEKKEELVTFDTSWLNEDVLKVENKDGQLFAMLKEPVMSFKSDQQTCGIQYVFVTNPAPEIEVERLSLSQKWQIGLAPFANKTFFIPFQNKVELIRKGNCNANYIRIYYIPAIGPTMTIPDGIVDMVVTNTVIKLKQIKDGTVVKKTQDNNQNTMLQSEMNLEALKP